MYLKSIAGLLIKEKAIGLESGLSDEILYILVSQGVVQLQEIQLGG